MNTDALKDFRRRGTETRETLRCGEVIIGGDTITCSVHLDPVKRNPLADGSGWQTVQLARVEVRKTLCPTAPAQRSVVRLGTDDFQVMEVGGHNAHALTWVLQCMRILPSS